MTTTTPAWAADAHVVADNLLRIYRTDASEVVALQGLDLAVDRGEFVAIVGASGSGKSTLMNILAGLDTPSAGQARVGGWDLNELDRRARTSYRRDVVGFVWQQTARNLVGHLDVRGNVELPMLFAGRPARERRERAHTLLERVGLDERTAARPDTLSGGEQQRLAIAIALANGPEALLADEPTGELDSDTAGAVFTTIREACDELGVTVVVVTHDPLVATYADRTVAIRDGRTSSERLHRREVHDGERHEYAVLDRAGRVQLPADFVTALGLRDRVRMDLESDRIEVRPDRPGGPGELGRPGDPGGPGEPGGPGGPGEEVAS